jgi:hypothetical protein
MISMSSLRPTTRDMRAKVRPQARERGQVAGAVAQQRQRLLRQRREDELADGFVRERLARLRIDDLDQEVVLVHVSAGPRLGALGRDAGAHHLREAVDVDGGQVESALDRLAQSLRPRLRAENAGAEAEPRRLGDVVGDREGVARRAAKDLRAEIFEQLRLPRRVATRCWDNGAAEALGSVVEAEAAGEEAVAVGDVDERARPGARRGERSRAAVRPAGEVAARVGHDRRLAAGSGGGVDPHALLERDLQEPERIRVPQLRLDAKGHLRKRLGLDAEPLPQPLALQPLELGPRQGLQLGLEDRHASDYPLEASARGINKESACAVRSCPSRRP